MGIPHCDDAMAFATTGHIGPSVEPWVVWRLRKQADRFTAGRRCFNGEDYQIDPEQMVLGIYEDVQ